MAGEPGLGPLPLTSELGSLRPLTAAHALLVSVRRQTELWGPGRGPLPTFLEPKDARVSPFCPSWNGVRSER